MDPVSRLVDQQPRMDAAGHKSNGANGAHNGAAFVVAMKTRYWKRFGIVTGTVATLSA